MTELEEVQQEIASYYLENKNYIQEGTKESKHLLELLVKEMVIYFKNEQH